MIRFESDERRGCFRRWPTAWMLQCVMTASLGCGTTHAPVLPGSTPALSLPPQIRVCLSEAVPSAAIAFAGRVRLRADDGASTAVGGSGVLEAQVANGAIEVRQQGVVSCRGTMRVVLEADDAAARWRLGSGVYRGTLQLLRVGERLTVVNELALEEYLQGVVPWEIGKQDPAAHAALEAQAIAARTYAYKRLGRYPESGFDVYADVTDQVYQGTTRTDSLANVAIRVTAGLVLWDQGEPIEAYYCSTCGGHTSRIEAVWNKPAARTLRGRRDAGDAAGSYCSASPHFRWSESWSGLQLERTLQQTLPHELGWPDTTAVGALLDLEIASRDDTGRVSELILRTTRGVFRVHGDRIRWVLRPRDRAILRSTLFWLEIERRDRAIVRILGYGGGNGHGVGMCQMGAIEMARRGKSSSEILTHYYSGAEIRRLY